MFEIHSTSLYARQSELGLLLQQVHRWWFETRDPESGEHPKYPSEEDGGSKGILFPPEPDVPETPAKKGAPAKALAKAAKGSDPHSPPQAVCGRIDKASPFNVMKRPCLHKILSNVATYSTLQGVHQVSFVRHLINAKEISLARCTPWSLQYLISNHILLGLPFCVDAWLLHFQKVSYR